MPGFSRRYCRDRKYRAPGARRLSLSILSNLTWVILWWTWLLNSGEIEWRLRSQREEKGKWKYQRWTQTREAPWSKLCWELDLFYTSTLCLMLFSTVCSLTMHSTANQRRETKLWQWVLNQSAWKYVLKMSGWCRSICCSGLWLSFFIPLCRCQKPPESTQPWWLSVFIFGAPMAEIIGPVGSLTLYARQSTIDKAPMPSASHTQHRAGQLSIGTYLISKDRAKKTLDPAGSVSNATCQLPPRRLLFSSE